MRRNLSAQRAIACHLSVCSTGNVPLFTPLFQCLPTAIQTVTKPLINQDTIVNLKNQFHKKKYKLKKEHAIIFANIAFAYIISL